MHPAKSLIADCLATATHLKAILDQLSALDGARNPEASHAAAMKACLVVSELRQNVAHLEDRYCRQVARRDGKKVA